MSALRHRVSRHARQSDRGQDQAEHADQAVGPGSRFQHRHELRNLFRHAARVERGDGGIHGGHLAAHGGDGVHTGRGTQHQGYAAQGWLGVIRRTQLKVNGWVFLIHHQIFGDILSHSHDLVHLSAAAEGAGAIIDGTRHGSYGRRRLAVAEFDLPPQWILSLP